VKDLTQGPIAKQVVAMALPIGAGMVFQTLYYLVDLYFVAGLGDTALAGVGFAGNVSMVIIALTQMLGVGTVTLVSHAAGRKDRPEANLIFNQSVLLSAILGVTTLVAGYGLTGLYVHALAADEATAAAPVAGQNFGAGHLARVKETFRAAAWMSSIVMALLTLLCLWKADALVRLFTSDPAVVAVGAPYLRILSWNFVATGLAFTCSSMFQALGNSWPSLISSGSRVVTYVVPAIWLGLHGNFELQHLWYLSVITVSLQAVIALALLQQQFRRRLVPRPQVIAS
jgi:Na+-driven multidrug efflux pump